MRLLILGLVMLCGASAARDISVKELNQHPENFDGQRVSVDGWVVIGDEARYLVSSKSAARDIRRDTCLSVINGAGLDARDKDLNGKHVVLMGVFRSDVFHDGVIRLGLCGKTALDLEDKSIEGKVQLVPWTRALGASGRRSPSGPPSQHLRRSSAKTTRDDFSSTLPIG